MEYMFWDQVMNNFEVSIKFKVSIYICVMEKKSQRILGNRSMVTLPTDSITLSKSCYCVGCTTTQSLRVGVEKFKSDNSSGERVPRCVRKETLQQLFVGDLLQV